MLLALLFSLVPQQPDIALIILDDVAHADLEQVHTPALDQLATEGVVFDRAYAMAWCSPTRQALLESVTRAGYYGPICEGVGIEATIEHSAPKATLPYVFLSHGYRTVLVGKWHMGLPVGAEPALAPLPYGFERWRKGVSSGGTCFNGMVSDNGVLSQSSGQFTPVQRNAFLEELAMSRADGVPFFGVWACTDAHKPWHESVLDPTPTGLPFDRDKYESEVRGLDTAIGQIVSALGPDAWIIVVGDNGTPEEVAPDPTRAKLTVFERGVHVPMIVSGPGLTHQRSTALVSVADIFPTLLAGLGWDVPQQVEGVSFLPALFGGTGNRTYVYVDNPTRLPVERAVVEQRYKLIDSAGQLLFFDLLSDPDESMALPLSGLDFDRLRDLLLTQ